MVVKQIGALAALSLGAISQQWVVGATLTPVIVTGDAVGGAVFSNAGQVVLADNGDVGMIAGLDSSDDAVLFSQYSGGGYTHSLVARDAQTIPGSSDLYAGFENLSLTTVGGASKLVFSSPTSSITKAGLFQSTNGGAASPIFYSGSGRTLLTSGSVGGPLGYGVSADGHVAFGTKNSGAQELHVDSVLNGIATGAITNFNQTQNAIPDQRYFVKRVALNSNSVVGVGTTAGTWGVYDFSGSLTPSPRYQTISFGLGSYAPRRLLGATGARSVVLAESLSDSTNGGLFYEHAGSLTPVITGINPGGANAASNDDPIGQMTASGRVAAYLPDTGLIYYDSTVGLKQLSTGVHGATTINAFGLLFDPVLAPMVNDNGWVVFEAVLPGVAIGTEAILAWQPATDILQVLVQTGDTVTINGVDRTILGFNRANPSFDSDVLRDGLNESNQVAFSVSTTGGAAVFTTSIVPEPGTPALVVLSASLLLRRRRPSVAGR